MSKTRIREVLIGELPDGIETVGVDRLEAALKLIGKRGATASGLLLALPSPRPLSPAAAVAVRCKSRAALTGSKALLCVYAIT